MNPLISVIVPCYNQAQYLDECLQSVLDQSYHNWECIIVNDGSPDHTEEVAKKWTEKDFRFKYIDKENGGLSSARNAGLKEAKGEWILPLDADDRIGNQYLELAEKEFAKNPTIIYCNAEFFGDKIGAWGLGEYNYIRMLSGNHIFCSSFFKKEIVNTVGGYDENIKEGREDWDFWLSILNENSLVVRLDYVGFFYRVKSQSMNSLLNKENLDFIEKYVYTKHKNLYDKEFTSFQSYLRKEQIIDKQKENLEYFTERINKNSFTKLLFKIILMLNRL